MNKLPKQLWILGALMVLVVLGSAATAAAMVVLLPRPGMLRFQGMHEPRPECSWTQLPDGRLLLVGGIGAENMTSAAFFDPKNGAFHPAPGTLKTKRCMHSAVLLPDGKVLLVGGLGEHGEPWPLSLERYDPATGRSEILGQLPTGAAHAPAVLLADGSVFVAALGSGEAFGAWFDPRTRQVQVIGNPEAMPMAEASAVRLDSGKVLVTGWGGPEGSNAFLFDPATHALTPVHPMRQDRFDHVSVLMKDGRVLIAGGHGVKSCEIFDPTSASFSEAGSLPVPMSRPRAARLPDGKVLIVGGREDAFLRNVACRFDPATGTITEIDPPKGSFLMGGMLQMKNGDVWLVSDTGAIAKYDARSGAWE